MKGLSEIVLSLCDLLEAEGRLARKNVYRATAGCAMILVAFFFVAGALAFLVAGFYAAMLPLLSLPLVMVACSLLCGVICVIIFWSFKIWTRTLPSSKNQSVPKKTQNVS